jgi:hypothetical protein
MANAPVFGDSNMTVTSSPANPPNKAEPAITTIAPTSTPKNVAFTLTVNGTNFDANAIVMLSGIDQPMATLTPTQLTATIGAATIKTVGTYPVQVRNANGTISGTVNLTVV